MTTLSARRLAWSLLALVALARCVKKRTGLVVWVETDMPQGQSADARPDAFPRLLGLSGDLRWGATSAALAPAGRDGAYTIRPVADRAMEDGSMVNARLPRAIFYVEPGDPDAMRVVRVTLRAEVALDAAGRRPAEVPTFAMEVPLLDGVTQLQVMVVDRACITNPPACGPTQTCGPGGTCVDVRRQADPGATPDTLLGACPDAGGTCVREGADVRGSASGASGCLDATVACDAGDDRSGGEGGTSDTTGGTSDGAMDAPDVNARDADARDAGGRDDVSGMPADVEGGVVDPGGEEGSDDPICTGPQCTTEVRTTPSCEPANRGEPPWSSVDYENCPGLQQAYTRSSVNLAYYPYVVTRATAPRSGTGTGASSFGTVAVGSVVGLQSTRNPYCSSVPPLRRWESPDGGATRYRFGYVVHPSADLFRNYGWIDLSALRPVTGATGECLMGAGGYDFQGRANPEVAGCPALTCMGVDRCSTQNSRAEGRSDCDGATRVNELFTHVIPEFFEGDSVTLRYAPNSSVYRWLRLDDNVRVILRTTNWAFVQVERSPSNLVEPGDAGPSRLIYGWLKATAVPPGSP